MKRFGAAILLGLVTATGFAQKQSDLTLLWKISGKGLEKASYLFGTIHMICKEDALLSDSLQKAISQSDDVYLEVDMDNMFEMLGAMKSLKMRDDTMLSDLLSKDEYEKVRAYFEAKKGMIPFSMIESYKPMLVQSMLMENSAVCDESVAMEQVIMQAAKRYKKQIKGLESLAYQASIFDSIPYQLQAAQLVKMLDSASSGKDNWEEEYENMMKAYKEQNLEELDKLINSSDETNLPNFKALLLDNRNKNWVKKLVELMPGKSLVVAVGAGHLPGDMGVINLLRKEGYKVTPVANKTSRLKEI
jgi:uncharacterized protein YbaP (TraB family)